MKKIFSGYYSTNKEFDEIMNNSAIVVDPEVLLSLYTFPQNISNDVIKVLKSIEGQLWMPYIMAQDYHKRIDETIVNKLRQLNSIIQKGQGFFKELQASKINVWTNDSESAQFNDLLKRATRKVEREMVNIRSNFKHNSSLRSDIADLFENRVGIKEDDPHPQSLPDIEEENMKRTDILENSAAAEGSIEKRDYHKIIISTLSKISTDKNKSIVYVLKTHHSWLYDLKNSNITYGPKPQILTMFKDLSHGNSLYCYVIPIFANLVNKKKNLGISQETFSFIKEISYNQDQKY